MDMKIEFGDLLGFEIPIGELPKGISQMPDVGNDSPFQVYILESAYRKMLNHVKEDKNVECGGVLVGSPFQTSDHKTVFVIIKDVIRNESRDRSVVHFTVSPEEVKRTRKYIAENCAGEMAIGWYHSHPGHGIFLSGLDMTIVKGVYNAPWNIAWVIDSIRQQEGVFYGADGAPLVKDRSSWNLSENPSLLLSDLRRVGFFTQSTKELIQKEPVSEKNSRRKLSIAYPKFLAKGSESIFLVQIYNLSERQKVLKAIKSLVGQRDAIEHQSESDIKSGKKIRVSLHCEGISFPPAKAQKIKDINVFVFTGTPLETCKPGLHKVLVSVFDDTANLEVDSFIADVKITDFVFFGLSRPFLSKLSSMVLGFGTITMFVLSYFEQIDKTFGFASGTSIGVIAMAIYLNFYSLYKKINEPALQK